MRLSQIVKLLDTRLNKKRGNREEKGNKEKDPGDTQKLQ